MGLDAWGWSSSDDPQLQSSAVYLQGQELQSVVAAVTPVMFDLSWWESSNDQATVRPCIFVP